jgi:ADP-heptose:LPS heptosyltransferase
VRVSADRIAIVRALPGLGDMLCAIPALRAVRGTAPRAHVTLVGLESARWVVERFHTYVDELLPFPGFPGLPEVAVDARKIVGFLAEAQERDFDLAIQLHGSGVASNAFTELLGATRTAGTVLPDLPCPDPELFVGLDPAEPEPLRLLRVVENLGATPARGSELEFPVSADDVAEIAEHDLEPGAYACLHPGASVAERRWGAEQFALAADALADRGLRVVLTGVGLESELTRAVRERMSADALDLAGATSLGATAAVLRDAAVAICNDTGVSHLAAAVGTPSVVVFHAAADTVRWAPVDSELHRGVGGPEHEGDVSVEDVLLEAVALLDRSDAQPSARAK